VLPPGVLERLRESTQASVIILSDNPFVEFVESIVQIGDLSFGEDVVRHRKQDQVFLLYMLSQHGYEFLCRGHELFLLPLRQRARTLGHSGHCTDALAPDVMLREHYADGPGIAGHPFPLHFLEEEILFLAVVAPVCEIPEKFHKISRRWPVFLAREVSVSDEGQQGVEYLLDQPMFAHQGFNGPGHDDALLSRNMMRMHQVPERSKWLLSYMGTVIETVEEVKMPSQKLKDFLDRSNIKYVSITHSKAFTAQEIAAMAHVPGKALAKTVLIWVDDKMSMAALPASYRVDKEQLREALGVDFIDLANEWEFRDRFPDCELGAMPPFGNLYGLDVYVAESLAEDDEITFNAGTHTELIRLSYEDFRRLVKPKVVKFSQHV